MGRRGHSIILIPFLAAAAAIHPLTLYRREPALALASQSPKAFSREPEPGKGSGEKTEEARRYTAKRIISQFLGTLPDGEWPDGDPRSKYRIYFLIATVPDPIESRLPIFFDRFLGSIQRAAERAGYVLDRFDLPWRPPALRIEGSKETIGAQSERQRRNAQEKDSNPQTRSRFIKQILAYYSFENHRVRTCFLSFWSARLRPPECTKLRSAKH